MKVWLAIGATFLTISTSVTAQPPGRAADSPSETRTTTCGNAAYDDGVSASSAWYGGGQAGEPSRMMGVVFLLADFGLGPGEAQLTGFCAGNDIDWGTGASPNEVFVYPVDDGGFWPDDSVILAQGTIWTGDGSGQFEVALDRPVVLSNGFWLMNRGDPMWDGEDFNMDFDDGPATGHSYVSEYGFLVEPEYAGYPDGVNYVLRAELQPVLIFASGFEDKPAIEWSMVVD